MITITDKEYTLLLTYVEEKLGIHLGSAKKLLVQSRLQQTLEKHGFASFQQYHDYLISDYSGAAIKELGNRLTTNHTFFMREQRHFAFLMQEVLPHLERTVSSRDLRIWSAGCSYGQEPYTLAMILADYFAGHSRSWDKKILATDISLQAIAEAKIGAYKKEDMMQLPERWRKMYFEPYLEERWRLKPQIRQEVIFKGLNLVHPFPFRQQFHVIFCRNVMIYFNEQTRNQLVNRFYQQLLPGGYLFIGHSEAINRKESAFHYVMPAVYRK